MDNQTPFPDLPVYSLDDLLHSDIDFASGAVFLINKPFGWSSFRVVGFLRKLTGIRKIGHAGTLDPMATGLLIVCTGRATKQIFRYQDAIKSYKASITFGASTPTYDKESEIDEMAPFDHISRDLIETTLKEHFTGSLVQYPPAFSAIKQNGTPLYKLARKGIAVELKPRQVHIYENSIIEFDQGVLTLDIICGKGTYIRSLAHDLGIALQSRAHLSALERTGIGDYKNSSALDVKSLIQLLDPHGKTGLAL
jgi:tRNA pseudouridine55 synthase